MPESTSKPHRRWLQFRLKTLLVIIAVLCVPLAWLAWKIDQKRQERAVIAELKRLGGLVHLDYEWHWIKDQVDSGSFSLDRNVTGPRPGPAWLRRLLSDDDLFASVVAVVLPPERQAYRAKYSTSRIRRPTRISYGWSDDWFPDGQVIDDDGLATVAKLKDLEELYLGWTDIGDAGLANLSTLTKLRLLDLQHTNVTDEGVARFKDALPNCAIFR
jgi:hypothetical protein